MEGHSDHNNEDTDLCHQLHKKNHWHLVGLESSVINGYGNAHVRCRWYRRSDKDAGDRLVTLSASQSTALHDKP